MGRKWVERKILAAYTKHGFAVSTPLPKRKNPLLNSFCSLTTGPWPLPKRVLHTVRSSSFSFNSQYPLFCLDSSNSCSHLLPRLPVTSILPPVFPSIMCFRRHFLRHMWPIQLPQPSLVVLYVEYSSPPWLYVMISIPYKHHTSKLPRYFWSTFEESKFQHHTKLCSKCTNSQVSFSH
jgi:hypothetical protein